jgi:RNA polymerase sigma-70 factor (ECF subfamily)
MNGMLKYSLSSASAGDEPDDDALLLEIAASDRHALRCLMTRHVRPMLILAERMTGNAADADDIVQEAFLKVWKMAPGWRPDGEARFSTWLYRVVLNRCLDRRRRGSLPSLDEVAEPTDVGPGGYDAALARQRRDIVAAAMAKLPERQRATLSLHYFGDLSAPDIAGVLGLTRPAVESLLVRGKRQLRKALTRAGVAGIYDVL